MEMGFGVMSELLKFQWSDVATEVYGQKLEHTCGKGMPHGILELDRCASMLNNRVDGCCEVQLCGDLDGGPFYYAGLVQLKEGKRLSVENIPYLVNIPKVLEGIRNPTVRADASIGSININVKPGDPSGTARQIAKQINNLKRINSQPILKNPGSGQGCACGDPFCGGCATGHARSAGGYATGGMVPPSNTVPVMLTPGYPQSQGVNVNFGSGGRTLDAYDVLKEIEPKIDCKIGMLSGCNFMVFRFTIPDREDWKAAIASRIDELKAKLGDKIGNLGDQKIVGLDEPYDPDGGPSVVRTSSATGKVAVHLARRDSYAAWKVTILALVKS